MKIRKIEIEPKLSFSDISKDNPLIVQIWVKTSQGADIRMPLGEEASKRLIECMAKELVNASIAAADEMSAHMLAHLGGNALGNEEIRLIKDQAS